MSMDNGRDVRRKTSGRNGAAQDRPIRYAVVGLGYISQVAVLPAFANARKSSELAALISGDPRKLRSLGKKYRVDALAGYKDYERCLADNDIDAVYIGLPNSMHAEYTVRAAEMGVHVLCEKPMAVTETECAAMMRACEANGVRLMIAYRLHFDPANLGAVEIVRSKKIGEARIFSSVFTMQVRDRDNIRLQAALGGGPLYDIGIYCINAARYIFGAEPEEVVGTATSGDDARFREVPEMNSGILRYPGNRVASFTCSFGASDTGWYQVVGTKGDVCLDSAYEYAEPIEMMVTIDDKTRTKKFAKHDQFAPELVYFSGCIRGRREPEPSGEEGLADVRIIRALERSARQGRAVPLEWTGRGRAGARRPDQGQKMTRPGVREPELVHADSPSGE